VKKNTILTLIICLTSEMANGFDLDREEGEEEEGMTVFTNISSHR
jgi:hypothetical protein